jgi:hypothetical protein
MISAWIPSDSTFFGVNLPVRLPGSSFCTCTALQIRKRISGLDLGELRCAVGIFEQVAIRLAYLQKSGLFSGLVSFSLGKLFFPAK